MRDLTSWEVITVMVSAFALLVWLWFDLKKFLLKPREIPQYMEATLGFSDAFVPSKHTVFAILDWRHGVVSMSLKFAGLGRAHDMEMASCHEHNFGYTHLAEQFVSNAIMCSMSVDGISEQQALSEVRSWNIVVSCTGRAHNVFPSINGQHPAALMQDALRHVRNSWSQSNASRNFNTAG